MQELVQYVNGEFVPDSEAKVSVWDRALSVGDAVFDTERTFGGKVFRLREHLERLYRTLHMVRIDPGMSIDEMQEVTEELARRNDRMRAPNGDYSITQMISRGAVYSVLEPEQATVVIRMRPIPFTSYAKFYDEGAHVVIPTTRRDPVQALDARLKTISRMNLVMAEIEAKLVDPEAYAVLLDVDGKPLREHWRQLLRGHQRSGPDRSGPQRACGCQSHDRARTGRRPRYSDGGGASNPLRRLQRRRGVF